MPQGQEVLGHSSAQKTVVLHTSVVRVDVIQTPEAANSVLTVIGRPTRLLLYPDLQSTQIMAVISKPRGYMAPYFGYFGVSGIGLLMTEIRVAFVYSLGGGCQSRLPQQSAT